MGIKKKKKIENVLFVADSITIVLKKTLFIVTFKWYF